MLLLKCFLYLQQPYYTHYENILSACLVGHRACITFS